MIIKTVTASSTRSATRGANRAPKIKEAMATKTQCDHASEKNTPVNAMLQYQDEEAAGEEDEEEREDCPCFSCQDLLGRDDEAVQCDSCDNWFCVACSELNKAAYNSITDHRGWSCGYATLQYCSPRHEKAVENNDQDGRKAECNGSKTEQVGR